MLPEKSDTCWSAESVTDKQVLVLVVIKLIAMIESKTEVEEGAMSDKDGGRESF